VGDQHDERKQARPWTDTADAVPPLDRDVEVDVTFMDGARSRQAVRTLFYVDNPWWVYLIDGTGETRVSRYAPDKWRAMAHE
jgi:hypothetical protein